MRIKGETQKEQEKAQTEISVNLKENIDVFKFLLIVQNWFPTYHFIEFKADGFVGELLKLNDSFSTDILFNGLNNHKHCIELFSSETANYLNPYTIIRYCIYLEDKVKYKFILYELQRIAYERWSQKK